MDDWTGKVETIVVGAGVVGASAAFHLAKLGGANWHKQKKAAERAVMDMAVEMLDLQAERLSRPGIAFAPDGEWQREFDAAFPYQETPDQLSAISEIKEDMCAPRPMERAAPTSRRRR